MKRFLKKALFYLEHYSNRWWYGPLLAFLAAADAYLFVISVEAFLLPAVIVRPRRWAEAAAWGTIGSAVGATSFAILTSRYGEPIVNHFFPHLLHTKSWLHSAKYINDHGALGLAFISVGPLPQHAAVALAGLAHMKTIEVFFAILVGRGVKYFFLAWAAVRSPKLLRKLRLMPGPSPEEGLESPR